MTRKTPDILGRTLRGNMHKGPTPFGKVIALGGLLVLSACAGGHQEPLHPKHHHGQRPPSWYKPPAYR